MAAAPREQMMLKAMAEPKRMREIRRVKPKVRRTALRGMSIPGWT